MPPAASGKCDFGRGRGRGGVRRTVQAALPGTGIVNPLRQARKELEATTIKGHRRDHYAIR